MKHLATYIAKRFAQTPIRIYRWTLKPLIGAECRHLPTCSEYGLRSIEINGAWRGLWLMTARVLRCRPGGSSGFDPAPDIRSVTYMWTPWRYGRWN